MNNKDPMLKMSKEKPRLITYGQLREALKEAASRGIPTDMTTVTFLENKVHISHPEDPEKTIEGITVGAVKQKLKFDGYKVQTQRTSQPQYQ